MRSRSTHVSFRIKAAKDKIYQALVAADAIARWKFPDNMTIKIHEFDGREGGKFRVSLNYIDHRSNQGKTSSHTDTYHGRFIELIPYEKVVQEEEFETSDPALQGKMTSTITLSDADGGTLVEATHENLPPGLPVSDNQTGWQLALSKLAALIEK